MPSVNCRAGPDLRRGGLRALRRRSGLAGPPSDLPPPAASASITSATQATRPQFCRRAATTLAFVDAARRRYRSDRLIPDRGGTPDGRVLPGPHLGHRCRVPSVRRDGRNLSVAVPRPSPQMRPPHTPRLARHCARHGHAVVIDDLHHHWPRAPCGLPDSPSSSILRGIGRRSTSEDQAGWLERTEARQQARATSLNSNDTPTRDRLTKGKCLQPTH